MLRRLLSLTVFTVCFIPACSKLQTVQGPVGDVARKVTSTVESFLHSQKDTSTVSSTGGNHPYAFLGTDHGKPVTWDRCSAIRYVVNQRFVDAGLLADLHAALAKIEGASSFRFVEIGVADVVPTSKWYKNWPGYRAPLAFALVDRNETDLLEPSAAASGGGDVSIVAGRKQFTSGSVVVASDTLGVYLDGFGPSTRGGLILHETLHTLGLDHVSDPESAMTPKISQGAGDLGPGDAAGLAALATDAPCA